MLRRDISRFDNVRSYRNLGDFFASSPDAEFITVKYGESELDLLHIDRGADTTIVCFHAALAHGKVASYPLFSALNVTAGFNVNVICVSDPALSMGLSLGWFAGTGSQPLQRDLPNAIRHLLSRYETRQRLIFFGASGGGFASLFYSHGFPGSIALAMNPQTDIAEYNPEVVSKYAETAWGESSLEYVPIVTDLGELYRDGFPNTVYFMQNVFDGHHRDRHVAYWMRKIPAESNRLNLLMDDWGQGHVPPPISLIESTLGAIIANDHEKLDSLGFVNAPTVDEPARQFRSRRNTKVP